MAKFINKKEQVFDLKLTSYGHYLLSIGTFKPVYYAFYDDNVIYDKRYAGNTSMEAQNEITKRIKEDTQYLESLVLFTDVEESLLDNANGILNYYSTDVTPAQMTPRKDIFKFDSAIGDAYLDGDTQTAPAWKIVALQSIIASSTEIDEGNNTRVPQINIETNYKLKIEDVSFNYDPANVRSLGMRTGVFADNKIIKLESNDPMFYIEEMNTQLLTENFEIEVFEITNSAGQSDLTRKYFQKTVPQIVNGFMVSETSETLFDEDLSTIGSTGSTEYYFDVLVDRSVNKTIACREIETFDKQSYYIDLDLNCGQGETDPESLYYDIYGSVTEPEICQD